MYHHIYVYAEDISMNETQTSYFDGTLLQQIGWRILASLIIGFSFGIATPWAVCMLEEWETKHTVINGRRLTFDGTGTGLFGKYIIWFLLTLVTFGIYGFWLDIKLKKWTVEHTHFADEN